MSNKDLENFCDRWLACWTGNNPDQLIQFYADNTFYRDPAHPEGIQGKKELLGYLKKLLAKYPDWIWEREKIFPIDQGFVLKWSAQFPGEKIFNGLDIVVVEKDKITRNEVYFDPNRLKRT